ncbi:MAG: amidohydrolase [Novosphingobium sp.]|nr:amidohydrolase [Novosphingobium sp.]MCP5402146.1 amidohydrolase [Novosphingobium sp.]
MDIVDAQIHFGPGRIDETLTAMDALGIRAVLIDEYWLRSFANEPHHALPGEVQRPVAPTAELAAQIHPERFSYLLRINREDPEYAGIVRQVRDAPAARALRIDPGLSGAERAEFAAGGYDHICKAAGDCGLPLFVFAPDQPEAFARLAGAFPDLRIVVDHCGLFSNSMRASIGGGTPALNDEQQLVMFDKVLSLADFPNVALKWGHSSAMFDKPAWPGEGLWPILRKAIGRFGAERIMWASDFSVNQRGESWADLLYGVLGDPDLTQEEREWVLGRTARTWLDWPV